MLFAALMLSSLFLGPALAEERGLVVRLEMGGSASPSAAYVLLKHTDGETTRVEVKDNGTPPDVTQGDGTWAGAIWLDGDGFDVSIELDGEVIAGGPASWAPDDAARDLSVRLEGGSVSLEAGVSGGGVGNEPLPGGNGAPGDPSLGAAGGGSSGAGAPAASGGGTTGAGASPASGPAGPGFAGRTAETGQGSLYIAFGIGLIVLVGVSWLWLRNRPGEAVGRVGGLALVPEPGLLGPGSPSLSDGLQVWIVPDADAAALLRPLLATLARHHRVLVVAPSSVTVPSVFGGPVYRSTNLRPSHVGDAAESLVREGTVVTVLLFGTQSDAASVRDYADLLPTGVGGVCVLTSDPSVPALARVLARRDGEAWVVQTETGAVRLVESDAGLEPEAAR